uniref:Uncharacterized protein n=1 Tax=Corethron hystrix TaxID=216773 RepID=A0A7S1FMS5_9STRA|mmetsp:Transcript_16663/g.37469  ORF Transcript_16663/g.37469 Transcript_16663/m.37469 type:complete len:138 (+) Transcript_16663:16-429(+)
MEQEWQDLEEQGQEEKALRPMFCHKFGGVHEVIENGKDPERRFHGEKAEHVEGVGKDLLGLASPMLEGDKGDAQVQHHEQQGTGSKKTGLSRRQGRILKDTARKRPFPSIWIISCSTSRANDREAGRPPRREGSNRP